MSTTTNTQIIERQDIHKSAKALEQICALFHDYCQAISAGTAIQKKLAKAMKDAAGIKGTHTTAGEHSLEAIIRDSTETIFGTQ